jgi:hypothetical protein
MKWDEYTEMDVFVKIRSKILNKNVKSIYEIKNPDA